MAQVKRDRKEYMRAYREAHRQETREARDLWYWRHRDKALAYAKAYREKNKDKIREYQKEYQKEYRKL